MKKEQAIHTSNKQYLKTAAEISEDFNPDLKVGTIVQAYGFPLFSGLKGENFYKIVSIDGDRVTFRRTNETGDLGNMGLKTYTTDLRAIKDAIESVEVGGGTSGLKIWAQPDEDLTNEMGVNDTNYKLVLRIYDQGGSMTKKKVGTAVFKDPNATRDEIANRLRDMNYSDIKGVLKDLRAWKESVNEMLVSDKTDGRVKQMLNKMKSKYSSLDGINYDTLNKTYLFAFGKKADADKLEKDFKQARNQNPDKAIGKFEFIRSADYPNDKPPIFIKQFKINESVNEVKYPTDLKVGSVIMGQGFTMLKGIEGGKYYKVVAMDDISATLVPSDKNGNQKGSSKVRHKLDSIEGGIKAAKRSDENGIVVIKESVNEARGAKTIQKDYDKVIGEIETTLESYKKAKGTPKAASFVAKLKALNEKKKSLAKELDDKVSGLYKDAELKMENMKLETLKKIIKEEIQKLNESAYRVYHQSYTSAVDAALNYAHSKGFTYDKEETAQKIGLGPKRPSEGKTNRFSINLYRGGKMEKNKKLQIQIYNRGNELDFPYELNCYVS